MTTRRKSITYITGSRADFGLMAPVLRAVRESASLSLRVYATGMHLMSEFGNTVREVEAAFPDAERIDAVIPSEEREGQAIFAGTLLPKVVAALTKNRPDFVLLLGDRLEMLVVALACRYLGIPTGHLHGGERSATVDDSARHAISRLASLHFPATAAAARRLRKMGEDDWRIRVVGAPALDVIRHARLPSREEVCVRHGLSATKPYILVLQHPVSEEAEDAGGQMRETIAAVKSFNMQVVAAYPNADAGGRQMIAALEKERDNPLFHLFPNISHADFLALERDAAVWVGNSSAALIESASFKTPVVNVGIRQCGRERGGNVIDATHDRKDIRAAIDRALTDRAFRARLARVVNPYGDGTTAERVVTILKKLESPETLLAKQIAY